MKKILKTTFIFTILILGLDAAPQQINTTYKNLKSQQSSLTKQFTKGSIVSGSTYGGTKSPKRWYIFNEGSVGGSYTILGKANYWSVDLGYHTYLRTIESAIGGFNFQIGAELNVPLYLKAGGRSNIITGNPRFETKESEGLAGVGLELPAMIGIEKKGFYIVGLIGYGWLFMKDTYNSTNRGAHPTVQTNYDGLIYGGGIGYKVSNVLNIGIRYMAGNMTNRKDGTKFDNAAVINGLDSDSQSITNNRGRDIYNIDYQRFSIFVALIF